MPKPTVISAIARKSLIDAPPLDFGRSCGQGLSDQAGDRALAPVRMNEMPASVTTAPTPPIAA